MERRPVRPTPLWAVVAAGCLVRAAGGQVAAPPQRFTTGGRDIVNMTFANTPIGELPTGFKLLQGTVEVVDKNGQHMLRASTISELEMPLPEILPTDFTVEFEFIPKQCCNPHDIGIEGTSVGHSNSGSAQITWHRNRMTVVGGGESFAADMPEALANSTPGRPTVVSMVWEGTTVKLYTNGRRHYTLSDHAFFRQKKLWIWLGGQDEDQYAVYVSRIRVIANGPPVGPIVASKPLPSAAGSGAAPATNPAGAPSSTTLTRPPGTGNNPTVLSDGPAPTVTVTAVPGGLKVSYDLVTGTQNYGSCREAPPGATCVPYTIGSASAVSGNTVTQYDLGLAPGTTYGYRVTAFRADGHYGQSAPASGAAGSLGAPANLRVTRLNASPAAAILEWDAVPYQDAGGPTVVQTYQVSGTGLATPQIVSATQLAIPFTATTSTYTWQVTPLMPNAVTGWQAYTPATFTYVCRYRIVAQAILVNHETGDNALTFDGAGDEVYLATVIGQTNRSLAAPAVTVVKSQTYGDVAGFSNRVQAGTLTRTGGLRTGDKVFSSLNTSAPAGTPSAGFPLLIWEGPMDDQTVVVTHTAIWEADKSNREYGEWMNTVYGLVKSSFGNQVQTVQGIQQLINAGDFGPITALIDMTSGVVQSQTRCSTALLNSSGACIDGEDRPIGLTQFLATVLDFPHGFLVFTSAAIERSLQKPPSQQPIAGMPGFDPAPGVIVLQFRDGTSAPPMGSGDYIVILRVERVP